MNENTPIPLAPSSQDNEIILYQPDSTVKLEVRLENETVWLTQQQMTELFRTSKQNISLHVNNIFKEGELDSNSVVKESLTTASDGKKYKTKYYNLDVILSVGYCLSGFIGKAVALRKNLQNHLVDRDFYFNFAGAIGCLAVQEWRR